MKTHEQLTFGLIGSGRFGGHYSRLLRQIQGVKLLATSQSTAESRAILQDPGIDCVIIASPPSSHAELALATIHANKHVLIEKPMVQDPRDAILLSKAMRNNKKVFMVGYQFLCNDFIRYLKKIIDKGMLGTIRYAFLEQLAFGPLRREGDCFWECASHEVSILDYLFGPARISQITGRSTSFSGRKQKSDFATASFTVAKNILATIVVSLYAPKKSRRVIIAGDKGLALFDDLEPENKLRIVKHQYPNSWDKTSSLFLPQKTDKDTVAHIKAGEPLKNQLEHFIHCVKTNSKPFMDIDRGLRVTKLMQQISKSIKHV
jgi:UDP-2-acetamido-3-amino-2,3-dideoxy-glucuronate N-acetyltransferase